MTQVQQEDTLAIAKRLLAKGPINKQTGKPYVWSLESRVALAITMAKVANQPELILLRSLKAKANWQDGGYRAKVLQAAREANADPLTAARRRSATEEALAFLRDNPHLRRPVEEGQERRFLFGGIAPRLDDREGFVYIAYDEDHPEGPYKIGSAFNWEIRKGELQKEGYHGFFKPGCRLVMIPIWVDWFRRVEIRAHEMLGMDWEYKYGDPDNKRYEMCWLSLPVIIQTIHKAVDDVKVEMKVKEEARAEHGKRSMLIEAGIYTEKLGEHKLEVRARSTADFYRGYIGSMVQEGMVERVVNTIKRLCERRGRPSPPKLEEKETLHALSKFIQERTENHPEFHNPSWVAASRRSLRRYYKLKDKIEAAAVKKFGGMTIPNASASDISKVADAEFQRRLRGMTVEEHTAAYGEVR